jgi:hypothetical protein
MIRRKDSSNVTPTSFLQTGNVTQLDGSTTHFMTTRGSKNLR